MRQTTFYFVVLGSILLCKAIAQEGPPSPRPPTDRSPGPPTGRPRPSPRPPGTPSPPRTPSTERPTGSPPRPPATPSRPPPRTPGTIEPPTVTLPPPTQGAGRPVIDVASPDEECSSRRVDDRMLEICKVGSEFCVDETVTPWRSRLVLQCRTVDESSGSGSGSGSGSESGPRVYYTWLRNGEHIADYNEHFSVEARGTELHFVRTIPGRYTCFAHNSAGYDNATTTIKTTPIIRFNVNVMGANNSCSRLRCPPEMADTCPFTGETLLYHCSASGGDSSPPVIMTPSGPAPGAFVVNNCPRLAINGRYTCSSSNECGVRRESVNVRAFEPARIDRYFELPRSGRGVMRLGAGRRREPVTVDVASNVELHCPVYGIEDPRVGWFKQRERNLVRVRPGTCCRGVTIRNVTTENRITLILSIRNLSANHYGRYVCRTNNRAGQDEGRVVLNEPGHWYAGNWSRCTRRRQVACYSADGERLLSRQQCSETMPHEEESCRSYYDYYQDRNGGRGGDRSDRRDRPDRRDRNDDRCDRRDRFDRRDRNDDRFDRRDRNDDRFDRRDRNDDRFDRRDRNDDRFDRRDRNDDRFDRRDRNDDRFDRRDRNDDRFDRRDRNDDRFDRRDRNDDRFDRRDRNDDRCDRRDRNDGCFDRRDRNDRDGRDRYTNRRDEDREGSCQRNQERQERRRDREGEEEERQRRCERESGEERQRRREREGEEERRRRRESEEEMRMRERERDERDRDPRTDGPDVIEFDRCPTPRHPDGMRPPGERPEPPAGPGMRPGGMRPGGM